MTMKKYLIALAVLVTALLSSCVQEKSFKDITVGENEMVFVMGGNATRSADGFSMAKKGAVIPMGKTDAGEPLFLEETIEELNPTPDTRGIPAYTSTVGTVHKELGVYGTHANFGDATFEVMDQFPEHEDAPRPPFTDEDGWRYHHDYNGNPWPDEDTKVDFYFRAPVLGKGMSRLTFPTQNVKTMSFDFTSPVGSASDTPSTEGRDAEVQEDILFGYTQLDKKQHDKYLPNGAPVMMYHALSAVKFRNGHDNKNQTKTVITKIEISGLKKSGHCVYRPEDNSFVWTVDETSTGVFTQVFADPAYVKDDGENNSDGTVDFTDPETNSILYGTSWTNGTDQDKIKKAAADHNLNDEDGSQTFWFVPQEITNGVTLKVTFRIKTPDTMDGVEITHTIDFGKTLNAEYHKNGKTGNVSWNAGQLRTYTLRPFDVDVEIVDQMTKDMKSDLHIANTGNVDEYVRMLIMGNWYGWEPGTTEEQMNSTEPSILVGYVYKGNEPNLTEAQKYEMVKPWFRGGYQGIDPNDPDKFVDPYGYFDDSFLLGDLGERDGDPYDWADASGGYYYTMKIGPGEGFGVESATTDLFKSYTVTNVPDIYLPVNNTREKAVGVHLVMEIVIQAIIVPKDEHGNEIWWLQAWHDATGIDKLDPGYVDSKGNKPNEEFRLRYVAGDYDPVTPSGE